MTASGKIYHIPALAEEALYYLDIKPDGTYVDVTFGGGGHSRAILKRLAVNGRLFAFDRDIDAYDNVPDDDRFVFIHSNFRYIVNFLRFHNVGKVDGILADLGVSSHHFDEASRGFSFRNDSPLDMRMNRQAETTAATLIAQADEKRLHEILRAHTDIRHPANIVKAIMKARQQAPIDTTFRLAEVIKDSLDPRQQKKELAQVFQALRIEVNHEMEDLQIFLESTMKVLKPGGRLVVLSYHSGEDRMVKNFMKSGNIAGEVSKDFFGKTESPWKLITRKPVEPSPEEIERNPRARSARLRCAEYIGIEK